MEHLRNENFVSFASEQLDGVLAPLALYRAQERLEGRTVGTSCSSLDEVARMVRTGIGIGALPEHVVRADLDASRLWKLPPEYGVARISLYLMWNQNPRFSEAEEVFFSCLLGALRAAE